VKSDYQAAFGAWVAQVGILQTMSDSEADALGNVRAKARAAEAVYRGTRDELAGMICASGKRKRRESC